MEAKPGPTMRVIMPTDEHGPRAVPNRQTGQDNRENMRGENPTGEDRKWENMRCENRTGEAPGRPPKLENMTLENRRGIPARTARGPAPERRGIIGNAMPHVRGNGTASTPASSSIAGIDPAWMLLTPKEAAWSLRICEKSLFTLTKSGDIQAVRFGRNVRYDPADLRNWIERQKAG